MIKYDIANYEFKKPSGVIHSDIFKKHNKKKHHYDLTPTQHDCLNLMMYKIKETLLKEFNNTANIINIIKNDYEKFEQIIDTNWFEIDWNELHNFSEKNSTNRNYISDSLEELENVFITTNIIDKNGDVGQTTFSLIRKYSKFKNKFKFKLEPELFYMIMLQRPLTNETFTVLKLKLITTLSTVSSKRLYEFLKDWSFRFEITISLYDIQTIMNVNKESKTNNIFANFNRDYLKKSIQEINEKSDIKVSYEPIKEKPDGGRLQVTKIKFYIKSQPTERLEELGLITPSIIDNKYYNKSKKKLDKLVKGGYNIIDEEMWIETDIKRNEDKYEAEIEIDLWLKDTDPKLRNDFFMEVASSLDDCSDPSVMIVDYRIVGCFSQESFTKNPLETMTLLNEVIASLA